MRIKTTIDRLTNSQWKFAQQILRTSYDIPRDVDRVCLVIEHRGEERHVEIPLGAYVNLVRSIGVKAVIDGLGTVMAALTPDALPDHLEKVRNAADPARAYLAAEWERVDPEGVAALRRSAAYLAAEWERVDPEGVAALRRSADMNRSSCEHGSLVVKETPSAFKEGSPSIRYADGCQTYGPYRTDAELPDDLSYEEQYGEGR